MKDLILNPPLWGGPDEGVIAYGPFLLERGKNKIVGMYLREEGEEIISIFDGSRTRRFPKDSVTLRGLEIKDAKEVGLDSDRAGLSKEDVISKALLAFQPPAL